MAHAEPAHDPVRYRFTVEEYEHMGRTRVFDPDDRLELIDGEIIEMNPIGWPHARIVTVLNNVLMARFGQSALVSPQNPLHLSDVSMPQPDLVLVRRTGRRVDHPTPGDVLLVVEVSDSTLDFDRRVKLPLYAKGGVPEVWIVDVKAQAVEVYRSPGPGGYQDACVQRVGDILAVEAIAGPEVAVAEVFE